MCGRRAATSHPQPGQQAGRCCVSTARAQMRRWASAVAAQQRGAPSAHATRGAPAAKPCISGSAAPAASACSAPGLCSRRAAHSSSWRRSWRRSWQARSRKVASRPLPSAHDAAAVDNGNAALRRAKRAFVACVLLRVPARAGAQAAAHSSCRHPAAGSSGRNAACHLVAARW